jgi:ABC-type dipeptide/oligopeptide/nickel transport system permease component
VLGYVIRRILWAGLLVVAMTFVTFVILFKIPNDPARFLVPNQNPTEHQLEVAREQLGVDDPSSCSTGAFSGAPSTWISATPTRRSGTATQYRSRPS